MSKKQFACLLNMKKIFFLLLLLPSFFLSFSQQKIIVTGTILTESDAPLKGVTVRVEGISAGTSTDAIGKFLIKVDKGATLLFSFVDYETQQIKVDAEGNIGNIKMSLKNSVLNDVVVVGYGTQNKKNIASSSVRVSASEFKSAIITTPEQALQGRATGVEVVTSSGEPGASAVVRIRGSNSISGNNEPLYVIDGFPMPNYREAAANVNGSYNQNGLYGINPNDIESMEVLKDASATAIYGSRGANGVVLITTKSGKRGEGRVELVNRTSIGTISNPIKMMNSKQYATIINETAELAGNPKPFDNIDTISTNTDWFKAVSRPSSRQDVTLSRVCPYSRVKK